MKLAFFTSIITDGHPTSGYEIANEAIVNGLRELGHHVDVFGFRLPRQKEVLADHVRVLDTLNLENSSASVGQKLLWTGRALKTGLPVAAAKLADYPQSDVMVQVNQFGPYDAHLLNSYQMVSAFPGLLNKANIYIAHNVEHRSARENALNAGSFVERSLYRREQRLLEELEHRLCAQSNYVWTFSSEDLRDHAVPENRGCVLPLTTPVAGAANRSRNVEFDAGLIGTWSWQPNLVGLAWFLEEVLPLLPARFSVAVAGTAPEGLAARYPGVQFSGRVDSASEFLGSARMVPLVSRGGTGVQLKTIEALQAGLACVATASSLRGIANIPPNCRSADDARTFARSMVELKELDLAGELPSGDGQKFYQSQHCALMQGLQQGLNHIT